MRWMVVALVIFLSMPASADNYGTTHALATAGVTLGTAYVAPEYTWVAGAASCGYFVYRESRGPGNLFGYPSDYQGKHSDADRILDWTLPCLTALGLTVWETKYGIFYPRPDGIAFRGEW